jgi:hypothetical protein
MGVRVTWRYPCLLRAMGKPRGATGPSAADLSVTRLPEGICVAVPHVAADGGSPDDAAKRYVHVMLEDGVARGPLVASLYDLGPTRGSRLAGIERPEP